MSKLDFTNLLGDVLATKQIEKQIAEYKIFYRTNFIGIKNRNEALAKLLLLCKKYENSEPKTSFYLDKKSVLLEIEAKNLIKNYFSPSILELFNKEIPTESPKENFDLDKSFLNGLLISFTNTFETFNEKNKQEWNYRKNLLIFLYNCLKNFGLHPDILRRDGKIYRRYNLVIEHFYRSKNKIVEHKILLKPESLRDEFLTPYSKKLSIKMNGKLIPFKSIYLIQITSTLLLDDEIELFSKKNNFTWNNSSKDEIEFIKLCQEETDSLHKNPYLINEIEKFRNHHIYFVHPTRIQELKEIESNQFDLVKLIRLCEELNNNSASNNNLSSSSLVRSIIDHIPPIFEFANFSQLANNYSDGTKSFKKAMINLDNSLRNIADNNIHSQVRMKEVLPTSNQINFSQELDLLLSEIVRKLK